MFNNFKVGTRLGLGFLAVLMLLAGIVGNGIYQFSRLQDMSLELTQQSDLGRIADEWKASTTLNLARVMAIAKSGNNQALSDYLQPQMKDLTARINQLQKSLEEQLSSEQEKQMLADIASKRKAYIEIRTNVFNCSKTRTSLSRPRLTGKWRLPLTLT